MKLTKKEKGTIIFSLELYAELPENKNSAGLKNHIYELIAKIENGE